MLIGGSIFQNQRYKSIPEQPDLLRVSPWKTARSPDALESGIIDRDTAPAAAPRSPKNGYRPTYTRLVESPKF